MPQSSETSALDPRLILEGQLREAFGRVVYSHKTHEKCADILQSQLGIIKVAQIALSALTTAGFVAALAGAGEWGAIAGALVSAVLLFLNGYVKNLDPGESAQRHRQTGSELWAVRERYMSLLTDIRIPEVPVEEIRSRRDILLEDLGAVYDAAPSTNERAYAKAQDALKYKEDMTFSDSEIDAFLPAELHRG